jgi:uncharacterized protein (TIGR02646 family)
MRKITKDYKSVGAITLQQWKRKYPTKLYCDLDTETRRSLRQSLLDEQYHLCAYCTCKIHNNNSHIDHIEPKGGSYAQQNKQLNYNNLVASCNRNHICGDKKAASIIPVTPLMNACETQLVFYITGRVKAKEACKDADKTLNILALKNQATPWLKRERQAAIEALLFQYTNGNNSKLHLEDEEILHLMKQELLEPNNQGSLEAYTPILINILNQCS